MEKHEEMLEHHGIKGMKWGVRRYQNEDGSLTEKGKKRYALKGYEEDSYNSNKTKAGKIYDKITDAHKYGGAALYGAASKKERDARAEKYVKEHGLAVEPKKSVKDMSDAELRTRLNRLQMEKQYNQLTNSDTNKGKKFVSDAMKVATGVATVSTTALTIYNNYGKIKKIVDGMAKK